MQFVKLDFCYCWPNKELNVRSMKFLKLDIFYWPNNKLGGQSGHNRVDDSDTV